MITLKILNTQTNQHSPAEVRSLEGDEMIVLFKDFETSKLNLQKLQKSDGDSWVSKDGLYSAELTKEDMGGGEKLVRVPKK